MSLMEVVTYLEAPVRIVLGFAICIAFIIGFVSLAWYASHI